LHSKPLDGLADAELKCAEIAGELPFIDFNFFWALKLQNTRHTMEVNIHAK